MGKFEVKRLGEIYLLAFDNPYDLAMSFVRYQEFYECASSKFRGKSFELLEFMEWYAKKYGEGVFAYPKHWTGFNIPGEVIEKVRKLGITDPNKYDTLIENVYKRVSKETPRFYLIGALKDDEYVLNHEIAHGLYYTNSHYRSEMKALIECMKASDREYVFGCLKELGYARKVLLDEAQAYLATGICDEMRKRATSLNKAAKPFMETFEHYFAELLSNPIGE